MGILLEDHCTFLIISDLIFLRIRNILEKKLYWKIKTHILYSINFPPSPPPPPPQKKSYLLLDDVGKYCRAAQDTRQNGACALRAGYLKVYKHTLRICNTYCFSTATIFALTRLSVISYLQMPVLYSFISIQPLGRF